jgi:hypothetical protein
MTALSGSYWSGPDLPLASLSESQTLCFINQDDRDRAWALGIFYLEIPNSLDIERARSFGQTLLEPDSPFRKIPQYGDLEGFIALENNQQTKLALRRRHWDQHYPAEIVEFGRELDAIGVAIIRDVLSHSGIPESCWAEATGGYAVGEGTAFLNFVHYDTRTHNEGLRPHTDYGFVTILDATKPGLQVELDGAFWDVPVRPGYLAIHFGEALNYITAYANRGVGAVRHRVLSQSASDSIRSGIVYFANPDLEGDLKQFDIDGCVRGGSSVSDFFGSLERKLTG